MNYASWDLSTAAAKISKGLPLRILTDIQKRLELSNTELAEAISIPVRTLARRRNEKRLSPTESERAWRIARLIDRAAEVLGGEEKARKWIKGPNYALGNVSPIEMAKTEPGTEIVEQLLGQIEHGIPV